MGSGALFEPRTPLNPPSPHHPAFLQVPGTPLQHLCKLGSNWTSMDYNWCQVPWCYAPLAAQQELKGSVCTSYILYIYISWCQRLSVTGFTLHKHTLLHWPGKDILTYVKSFIVSSGLLQGCIPTMYCCPHPTHRAFLRVIHRSIIVIPEYHCLSIGQHAGQRGSWKYSCQE